ncbi:MAG: hypothetical protein ACRYG6_16830 [Janthinobacterium lividum]
MTHSFGLARATLLMLAASAALGACSSSFGSGGGSSPSPTYVVMPNGETVPAAPAP